MVTQSTGDNLWSNSPRKNSVHALYGVRRGLETLVRESRAEINVARFAELQSRKSYASANHIPRRDAGSVHAQAVTFDQRQLFTKLVAQMPGGMALLRCFQNRNVTRGPQA